MLITVTIGDIDNESEERRLHVMELLAPYALVGFHVSVIVVVSFVD